MEEPIEIKETIAKIGDLNPFQIFPRVLSSMVPGCARPITQHAPFFSEYRSHAVSNSENYFTSPCCIPFKIKIEGFCKELHIKHQGNLSNGSTPKWSVSHVYS